MKAIFRLFSIFLLIIFIGSLALSQNYKYGLNSAVFLNVGVGARSVGLGTASTALSNDANQVFGNPAGAALKDQTLQASVNYNKWIGDLNHNCAAISYNFKDIGTLSLGIITFGASDIPADRDYFPNDPILSKIQIDQNSGSTFNYMDMAVSLTYSRYLMDNLSLGITGKYINSTIDDLSASAFAVDIGSIYDIGVMGWKIAARLSNLGSDIKFYEVKSPIPMSFSIGTSFVPVNEQMVKVMVAIDGVKPQDGPQQFNVGGEVTLMDIFMIRSGYKLNYSGTKMESTFMNTNPADNTIEGISFGAGVKVPLEGYDVRFDYSYTSMDLLSATHRVSLHFGMK
jgi:hypothetical protein